MSEPITKLIKYVYLDVVGFTAGRSVEAQIDIVASLNGVVVESVRAVDLQASDVIFLPAGDGMGLAILNESLVYDIHLRLGLNILELVDKHNSQMNDESRKYSVRIGLNQNVDNVVTDINGNRNVAGAGINEAQRLMSIAESSQLFVGQTVFDTLSHRERYLKAFRRYDFRIKHGQVIPAYQFVVDGHRGLATAVPTQFREQKPQRRPLSLVEAYYLAYSVRLKPFILQKQGHGVDTYALVVLLWYLAIDAAEIADSKPHERATRRIYGRGNVSVEEAFAAYANHDFWVISDLSASIRGRLSYLCPYLEGGGTAVHFYFVNERGKELLQSEHKRIWTELCSDLP